MWRLLSDAEAAAALAPGFDWALVGVSIVTAMLFATVATEVADRAKSSEGRERSMWLLLGTAVLSAGVWAADFSGLTSYRIPVPVALHFGAYVVAVLPVVIASYFMIRALSRPNVHGRVSHLILPATLLAGGVFLTDFLGMESIDPQGLGLRYLPGFLVAAILAGPLLDSGALWFWQRAEQADGTTHRTARLLGGASLGGAIAVVQFLALASARFVPTPTEIELAEPVDNTLVAITVLGVAVTTALVATLSLVLDRILREVPSAKRVYAIPGTIVVLVGLLVLFSAHQVNRLEDEVQREAGVSLATVVSTAREALLEQRAQQASVLRAWADESEIRDAIAVLPALVDDSAALARHPAQAEMRAWFDVVDEQTNLVGGFALLDPETRVLAASDPLPLGEPFFLEDDPDFIPRVEASGGATSLPIFPAIDLDGEAGVDTPVLVVGVPLRVDETLVGYLLFREDPYDAYYQLINRARIGATGETYAVSSTGLLLSESRFAPQLRRAGMISGDQAALNLRVTNPGVNIVQGGRVFIEPGRQPLTRAAAAIVTRRSGGDFEGYFDYRGVPVVGYWLWIDELNLGLITEQDVQEAMIAFREARGVIVTLTSLASTILLALAILFSLVRARSLRLIHLREVEQNNQRLSELNEVKNRFLGMAAHDLRNPLASIRSFSEILMEQKPKDHEDREFLSLIHENSAHMLHLVNELLDVSVIESGQLELDPTEMALARLLQDRISVFQPIASEKGTRLELQAEDDGECIADRQRLTQVIDNLVSNAIKFSPAGTTVRVRQSTADGRVRFTVKDQGPGLTEEDRTRMFGQFARLSARPTGGESSTGLGLSIVKQIVDAHDGTITVESTPGEGAEFIVEIPVAGPSGPGGEAPHPPPVNATD